MIVSYTGVYIGEEPSAVKKFTSRQLKALCYSGIKMQAQAGRQKDRQNDQVRDRRGLDISSAFYGLMGALIAVIVFTAYANDLIITSAFYFFGGACALAAAVGVVMAVAHRLWFQLMVNALALLFCGAVLMGPYFLSYIVFTLYTVL